MGRLDSKVEQPIAASPYRIIVTGAGGWLGMATLELLRQAFGPGLGNRVACFGSTRRSLQLLDGTQVVQQPLSDLANLDRQPSLLLHLAFLTKDRAEAMEEADYIAANRQISRTVIDALDRIGVEAVFVASSGAAARADDPGAAAAMRLYGRLKREDEHRFEDWAGDGRRAVIARIFNFSGPHINKHDSYALASFIRDSLAGTPITIRAAHPVVRTYVAIRELMSLVFALLLDEERALTRFDTGGEEMELGAVAAAVARTVRPVAISRPEPIADKSDIYVGEGAAYRALLAEYGIAPVPFAQQLVETAEFLASFQSLSNPNRVAMGMQPC